MSAAGQLLEVDDLATHRDLITQFLSFELKAVERIHKSLSVGHIAGVALLGKPSSLVHATELLKTIRQQVKLLTKSNSRLRTLSHPILRCPSDLLHIIFRFTTNRFSGRDKFKEAIKIAHVSQQWRRAAFDFPELRVEAVISPRYTAESAEEYLTWIIERARAMPLDLTIGPAISSSSYIFPRNLAHIVAIDDLTILIKESAHFTALLGPRFPIPRCNIGRLSLSHMGTDQSAAGWDINALLAKWPPIDNLTIQVYTNIAIRRGNSSKTTKLHLRQTFREAPISVLALNATFRKLTFLSLSGVEINTRDLGNTRVIMEALTEVIFNAPTGPLWRYLLCPRLLKVTKNYGLEADFLEFLGLHRTIQSLSTNPDVSDGERPLKEISVVSPQITTLRVEGNLDWDTLLDWRKAGLTLPTFPFLESLSLWDTYRLTFKDVESIIRCRCLPNIHVDSLKDRGVKTMKFMSFGGERGTWNATHASRWASEIDAPDIWGNVEMKFDWSLYAVDD
jgi:hypothetical protein